MNLNISLGEFVKGQTHFFPKIFFQDFDVFKHALSDGDEIGPISNVV